MAAFRLKLLAVAALLVACGCGDGGSPSRDGGGSGGKSADAGADTPDVNSGGSAGNTGGSGAGGGPVSTGGSGGDGGAAASTGGGGNGGAASNAGGRGTGGNGDGAGGNGASAISVAIPVDKAVANGWSLIPITVRTNGAALPTSADLTFSLSRLEAGTLRPRVVAAGAVDPQLYFTPCDGTATPGCLGPVTIRVARSAEPATILAETPVLTLTADMDVGSPAGCLLAKNALLLEGNNNSILFGISLVREGTFDPAGAARQRIKLGVNPVGQVKPTYGAYWNIEVSGAAMMDLTKGIYRKSAGAPETMTISRTSVSSGCSAGAFQILDLVWAGNQLETFLATFDLGCGTIGTTLRGCVRFSAQ